VQDIAIEDTIPHPDYNSADTKGKNDIALVRLSRKCEFSAFVEPICLPLTEQLRQTNLDGVTLFVSGWGWGQARNASEQNIKLKAEFAVVPLETCRSMYPSKDLWVKQLCAGVADGK
jgi:Trypsin